MTPIGIKYTKADESDKHETRDSGKHGGLGHSFFAKGFRALFFRAISDTTRINDQNGMAFRNVT